MKRCLTMFERLFDGTLLQPRGKTTRSTRRPVVAWLTVPALLGGAFTALPSPFGDSLPGVEAGWAEQRPPETARRGPAPSPRNLVRGQWTWVGGSSGVNQTGTYGTQGVAAPGNAPGARSGSVSWTDTVGNLWLFGGIGYGRASDSFFNDLWKFDISVGQWTWVSGSNVPNQTGTYGTQGVTAPGNVPGARNGSVSWTDTSGNLWLFGGLAYSAHASVVMNDLWTFNISSGQWTWVSGSNRANQAGMYGAKGMEAAGNGPGARQRSVSWIDSSGDLWLFGGLGNAAIGIGELNDLWMFDVSSGLWTWVSGSNVVNRPGTYGLKGSSAPGNVPGARDSSVSWTDSSGNLWLIGGIGYAADGVGQLKDIWMFNISSSQWTWVSGSDGRNRPGTYGSRGTPNSVNGPGARQDSISWKDYSGNLWLFGGSGYGTSNVNGDLNDLWKLDIQSGVWTWISGWNLLNRPGRYGSQGSADPANVPGARHDSVSWTDAMGNLWVFGGFGYAGSQNSYLNDLWVYANPAAGSNSCTTDTNSLCLLGGRFKVAVDYANYDGESGQGKAVTLTPDTGYFWFSSSSNVEVVAKMVSFCGSGSNNVAVYAGGLTDLDVTLHVTDTQTGAIQDHHNALGTPFQLIRDGSFACPAGLTPPLEDSIAKVVPDRIVETTTWAAPLTINATCTADTTTLCLLNGRFQVRAAYQDYGGKTGTGQAVTLTSDTGMFWLFDAKDVEVVTKMVSFCGGGSNNVGIYSAGLTDVEVTLTVTDTLNGLTKTYTNDLGMPFRLIRDGPFSCP
jgi:Kelch motif/Galactose oxidase, central domain